MDNQLNELSKGEKGNENPNKYNLRSKKKEGKPNASNQHNKTENSARVVVSSSKEKEDKKPQTMIKTHVPEIKEILKSPSSLSFENEIQKTKIPVPFLEMIKNEEFKKYLSKMLQPESSTNLIESVNLQD